MAPTDVPVLIQRLSLLDAQDCARIRGRFMDTDTHKGNYPLAVEGEHETIPFGGLEMTSSNKEYGIIHVRNGTKSIFPGYREQFVIYTDVKPFIMHLTGGTNENVRGEEAGGYLCHPRLNLVDKQLALLVPDSITNDGSFKRFYEARDELMMGDPMTIFRLRKNKFFLAPF